MIIDPLGIVPIERGGTGATTAEEAKEKLGIGSGGTVLYSNSSGTTNKITLSDDVSNYSYLEILYRSCSGGSTGSTYCYTWQKVLPGDFLLVSIEDYLVSVMNPNIQMYFNILNASGNTITPEGYTLITFSGSKSENSKNYGGNYTRAYILKVVGYK